MFSLKSVSVSLSLQKCKSVIITKSLSLSLSLSVELLLIIITRVCTSNREVTTHSLHYQRLSKFQVEIILCSVQIREGTRIALQFKTLSLWQGIENSQPITSSPMNLVTINNRSDQSLEQRMMDENKYT